jgi:hypothetical protein
MYLLDRVPVARRDGRVDTQVGSKDLVVGGARLFGFGFGFGLGLGSGAGAGAGFGIGVGVGVGVGVGIGLEPR